MPKLQAMHVAALLTAAVMSNLPDNIPLDPEVRDPNLRAENLMTWEIFRIFYRAVVSACDDDSSWPAPKTQAIPEIPKPLENLTPLLGKLLK